MSARLVWDGGPALDRLWTGFTEVSGSVVDVKERSVVFFMWQEFKLRRLLSELNLKERIV